VVWAFSFSVCGRSYVCGLRAVLKRRLLTIVIDCFFTINTLPPTPIECKRGVGGGTVWNAVWRFVNGWL
jgi:hypothetical protein